MEIVVAACAGPAQANPDRALVLRGEWEHSSHPEIRSYFQLTTASKGKISLSNGVSLGIYIILKGRPHAQQ